MSVGPKSNRLAVDKSALNRQAPDRLRNHRQAAGEICAMPRPERRPASFLPGDDPIAVVLDLMQPVGAGGQMVDENWLTRTDKTSAGCAGNAKERNATTFALM